MNDPRSLLIMVLFAWFPYAVVAWGYAKLTDSGFWLALGVLLAIRIFFSVIEALGSVLAWRLHGKKRTIERNLSLLRSNDFPRRKNAHDDFLNHLGRIESDDASSQQLRSAAKQWEQTLAFLEASGILLGMRMHSAADEALDVYSPRPEAPVFNAVA